MADDMGRGADWDARYAKFCAERGFPRFDFVVRTREEAIGLLGIAGEEFSRDYPTHGDKPNGKN